MPRKPSHEETAAADEKHHHHLSRVIHDVRTDLFNIQVAAEYLAATRGEDPHLASIRRSVARIDALLHEQFEEPAPSEAL